MSERELLRSIGHTIRQHRITKPGVSQEAFADAIGMHRAYYAAIERGEKNVTIATLHRIALGLGVPIRKLLPIK